MYLMQTVSHQPAPRKVVTVMEPPVANTKKQKSKWSLGSLFRRRTTNKLQQEASQSSSEDEETKKPIQRSFLGHRRSNRKRSERKAAEKSSKIKIEQPHWSGSANSLAGSSEGFGSHSSLTRKDRRELVKARVEATRRDSSSEDNDCTLKQTGSLTRFKSDDSLASLNRRSRAARTERYIKRMEKSSEPEIIPPHSANWNAAVMGYRETSPYVRAVSATPSPVVSPKMGHRIMPLHMMSPPRVRRSYCCEPPPFLPRHGGAIPPQMYPNSAFIPFTPKQAPPPPPRDPMRKIIGQPHHYVNVEAKPVYRSRSDHQLPQSDVLQSNLFPSSSQTHFKYLADRTPRSRRPIHVIPVHEQSPECILPTPPAWLNEPPPPKKSMSPPIRRVSSIEVTLRAPSRTPPPPPVRRYSRQGSVSSVEDEVPKPLPPTKPLKHTSSNNLEDALNELEEIYQSLQLGDEDLLDRAERRDLPTAFQLSRATSADISDDNIILRRGTRAPPLRRSGVPDLVMDDMAFRRLNNPTTGPPSKDRTSGSYLLVSPALSPIPVQTFDPEEPNTTYDDMSYRAIKDANQFNSKVQDPQPPFGIPLAPAPPASNNDYLHAKPTDKYRPTFRPRKTPDVVNDDLAFRNLRKDNNKMGELKRKRAVRSLSANLMNLMDQREDIEKTQSLVNLPDSLQVLYEGTEMRSSPSSRPPPSWVERANLLDTSTETLTQSRANLKSLRNSFLSSDAESRPLSLFMPANQSSSISPIKEVVSSVPSSASTEYSVPFDEEKLEELLSALAQEAHDTSERLGRELERLRDGSHSVEDLSKSPTLYQGKQCEVLKFEANPLTSSTNYVPVYNHSESETNPPKALHEDVNNNSKPDLETEKPPALLTETLETNTSSETVEPQCTQITPPEPKKFESPRSRTTSSHNELCTIEEECQFDEDGTMLLQVQSNALEEIPRVVIEECLSEPEVNLQLAEETQDSKISQGETARSCDEDYFTMLVEDCEGINAISDQIHVNSVENQEKDDMSEEKSLRQPLFEDITMRDEEDCDRFNVIRNQNQSEVQEQDDDSEEKSTEQPSSEDDGGEILCQKFNIPKLNLENIDENIDYDEEQFENLYNESFSEEIDEEAVKEFENLSNLIVVETANTALSCEHVHLPSESSCLSSINSSLTLDESNSKCSENVPEIFDDLFNRNNNVPEVENKVSNEDIYSINETVDFIVEKKLNIFKAFSKSSDLVKGSESKSLAEDETDLGSPSPHELNVNEDANGNDSTIETPFADTMKTTSELLVTNEEDCDPVEEAEQYSLTDHSTLLLPLLQMVKADNHPSSTFHSTVEKLDALIAAASDVDTHTHASCVFENNNCKSSLISRADDSAFEEVPSDERDATDFDHRSCFTATCGVDAWRRDPSQSAFRTPPGHRSPSIRNVFQVAEPCVEAMNSQIKASEKRRLASVNVNGSPKVEKAHSASPVSSGAETGDKSPPKKASSQQRRSTETVAATQIRTTRASRLRAAAASNTSPSSESALSDSKTHSSSATRLKSTPLRRVNAEYPDSSSSSREGTPISKNVTVKVEEKDKSSKRKSNLNRGLPNEKTGVLSSGDSTTDESILGSRLKSRMAPSPRASNRPLRSSNTPPSTVRHPSYNQRQSSEPAAASRRDSSSPRKTPEAGNKVELSKRVDSLLARTKEYETRLDNLASKKATAKNRTASAREKKILDIASKENEKNIEKGRRKDCEETQVEDETPKKILAPNNLTSAEKPEKKQSILKKKSVDDSQAPISILKHKEEDACAAPLVTVVEPPPSKPQSILKKKHSFDEPSYEERSAEELDEEPQGILKRKTSAQGKRHTILKKKSSEELTAEEAFAEPRPILKKRASTDDEVLSSNEADKPRPILKSGRCSADGDKSNYSSAATSPSRRSPSVNVEDAVIRNQVNLQLKFNQDGETARPAESGLVTFSEDENSRPGPSVSERAQLFMRLQELHKQSSLETPSTSKNQGGLVGEDLPPSITTRRDRARRFATQPVTSEEVDEAKSQISNASEPSSVPTPNNTGDSDDEEDEEPSNLSLAEKLRLFTQKIEQQHKPKAVQDTEGQRRTVRRHVTSTRFRTLPVTGAEVQGVSPLVACFSKQPDPAVLDGLSLKAAREAVYEHAVQNFTSQSKTPTIPELAEVDLRPRGILKHGSTSQLAQFIPSSTEVSPLPTEEMDIVRGILKIPASVVASALCSQQAPPAGGGLSAFKSALKKDSSFEEKSLSPTRSILKSGAKADEWTASESSSEEDNNIKQNLASILSDVAEAATASQQPIDEKNAISSDECDTSSSGGREVKNIICSAMEYRHTVATATLSAAVAAGPTSVHVTLSEGNKSSAEETSWATAPPTPVETPRCAEARAKFEAPLAKSTSGSSTTNGTASSGQAKKEIAVVAKMSIAERLAALKHSGETEWKKRVPRTTPDEEITVVATTVAAVAVANNYKPLQQSKSMPGSNRGILAEKLKELDVASKDWKRRVVAKDAVDFSVAGRMGVDAAAAPPSPLLTPSREKKTPKPARFKSKKERNNRTSSKESDGDSSTPESPVKELKAPLLSRSISAPETQQVIKVPSMTDNLDQFFTSTAETISFDSEEVKIESLPEQEQHTLLVSHRKTVQVHKRRNATRNPLRTLAARTDIVQEYQEIRTGVAERELKRLNVEKLAKNNANLAVEALAGLASKEDFTAVTLKKSSDEPVGTLLPFRDLMLLQVKGRRHVQTRLLEPTANKVNQGDSYVLVTPNAVYNWLGKFSNVIERTRSAELALQIAQRKDLGCLKAAGNVFTIDEAKNLGNLSHKRAFWRLLGVEEGTGEAQKAGHPDEDEEYENLISETNQIWTVEGSELVPVDKYWGAIPRIEVLDPNKVVVFDFGSEVYVWNGKNASSEVRRFAAEFVQEELWTSVDYSDCDISPVGDISATERPEWAILGKLSQHMETALFREKFLDWPEFSRVIKVKDKAGSEVDGSIEVVACDANQMAGEEWTEPNFELETSHIGRGEHYFDPETRRHFEIATTAVQVWHIDEFEYYELPEASMGQFHEGDSYVVRWNYSITVSGRELSGAPSKHGTVGRHRCAYFFWQGSQSSLNEQGAAALLTVELDKEQGPQVRVVQGSEPAVFLGFFDGQFATHRGRRQEQEAAKWRLYIVQAGSREREASLLEVPPSTRQLRSRSSLLLIEASSGRVFVWHGAQAHKITKACALRAAQSLQQKKDFGLKAAPKVEEVEEGDEPNDFFKGLGGNNTGLYHSLPSAPSPPELKMFHFSSASGTFEVQQLLSQARTKEPCQAFPFVQRDLYELSQPALVLVDAGSTMWLWQGWWPDPESGEDSVGSGAIRWQAERRAAMQTAVNYWKVTRNDIKVNANLVWAGLESLEFTNLFPDWQDRDEAVESNMRDGRKPGDTLSLDDELARLTQSTYPPAQLLQRPLPDGVDPTKLELYLAPEHFEELLGMCKEEFSELPTWKQTNVKKQVGLF